MIAPTLCLLAAALVLFAFFRFRSPEARRKRLIHRYLELVDRSRYFLHAMGGMDGVDSYTNSLDAMKYWYQRGFRLFEADVSLTSDGVPVLAHSVEDVWKKKDWEQRLGQPYDKKHPSATFEQFMSFTIQGKYHATSFSQLLDYLEQHKDLFVLVDVGRRSYESTAKIYQAMVEAAKGREQVLDQLIAGGHTTEMMAAVEERYDFPIKNLYYAAEKVRDPALATPAAFAAYCQAHHVLSYSIAVKTVTPEIVSDLKAAGLRSYVFAVNDEEEAHRLFQMGVDMVGSDFLRD